MKKISIILFALILIIGGGYFGKQYLDKKKEEKRIAGLNLPLIKIVKKSISDDEERYNKYKDSTGDAYTQIQIGIMKSLRDNQAELDTLEHWDKYSK